MKRVYLHLILGVFFINAFGQGFQNPVLRGFNPDPSICRVDDDFYLVTSSFEYFPGLPIYHSKDLVHWRQIGHCLTRDSQLPLHKAPASGGLFAPSLRYHDGLFYVICTNVSAGGNFFCTATNPAGPWSEPVLVAINSIDPDIFWDDDGKTYFVTQGDEGIRVTPYSHMPTAKDKATRFREPVMPTLFRLRTARGGWFSWDLGLRISGHIFIYLDGKHFSRRWTGLAAAGRRSTATVPYP